MITSVNVHLDGTEAVNMGQLSGCGMVWLTMGDMASVYFKDTASARLFFARSLSELRRVERGDLPHNVTDDKIEIPQEVR